MEERMRASLPAVFRLHHGHSSSLLLETTCADLVRFHILLIVICPALAFWRLECHSCSGTGRIDPMMSSGKVGEHAHIIHGGQSLSPYRQLQEITANQVHISVCSRPVRIYYSRIVPAVSFKRINLCTGYQHCTSQRIITTSLWCNKLEVWQRKSFRTVRSASRLIDLVVIHFSMMISRRFR